jgi:porphobilinogen synthase
MFESDAPPAANAALPTARPRRTRRTAALRAFVRETTLTPAQMIHPFFIVEGTGIEKPISTMPGHAQRSVDRLAGELDDLRALGIRSVLLFGIPKHKDATGTGAWDGEGPVARAIREIKRRAPEMLVIADVCLCEYTSHGHCGVIHDESGHVSNDETLPLLARAAVCYAQAGADIVAPSAMMDGQVAAIRRGLDDEGLLDTPILSYAAKHASAFYGPFREAAESPPSFGDRRAYQMDPANAREAIVEVQIDVDEGADLLMVKPAGSALDIIRQVRDRFPHPLVAYQVSGEYAMLKAAAERGWLDEPRAAIESLVAIRRAGADQVITYYAKEVSRWLSTQA